jgi:hypothetical protein
MNFPFAFHELLPKSFSYSRTLHNPSCIQSRFCSAVWKREETFNNRKLFLRLKRFEERSFPLETSSPTSSLSALIIRSHQRQKLLQTLIIIHDSPFDAAQHNQMSQVLKKVLISRFTIAHFPSPPDSNPKFVISRTCEILLSRLKFRF